MFITEITEESTIPVNEAKANGFVNWQGNVAYMVTHPKSHQLMGVATFNIGTICPAMNGSQTVNCNFTFHDGLKAVLVRAIDS